MIAAGEKFGASGGTNRLNVEAIKLSAVAGELIEVRGVNRRVAVNAHVSPTLVVGEHHNDVGRRVVCGGGEVAPSQSQA